MHKRWQADINGRKYLAGMARRDPESGAITISNTFLMNIVIRAWLTAVQKICLAGNIASILNGQVNLYNSCLKRHCALTVNENNSSGCLCPSELAFRLVMSCSGISTEIGGWESIEMVQRYAHLAPNHLTEHARQIDAIFGSRVPNQSHGKFWRLKEVVKRLILFGTPYRIGY